MASEGSEFVLKTPKGLAKTGTQIVTTKVVVDVVTVRSETISLNDEDVSRLEALVSGDLVVDAPELLKLAAVGVDQLATIELSGNTGHWFR